jgi:phosphomannomutase/phosphoglucomutase
MFEKNNRDEQSVAARVAGNAPRAALLSGVAVIVIGLALVVAFLMLVREPAQQTELLNQTTAGYAAQRARLVEHTVDSLRTRIKAAAVSPVVQELIGAQAGDQAAGQEAGVDLGQIETAMQSYFPEALSLRLVPLRELGTADLDAEVLGLRNHIEVDLVRRANNGEEPEPEAYQVEGAWIASLATIATNPEIESRRAVVLLSLDQTTLESWLTQGEDTAGRFVLEQRLDRRGVKRQQAVVSQGTGTATHSGSAIVRGTPWYVLFSPSAAFVSAAAGSVASDYDMLALTLALGLLGLLLLHWQSARALRNDVNRILEGPSRDAGIELRTPALLPLATGQRARSGQANGEISAPEPDMSAPRTRAPANTAMTTVEGPATSGLPAHIFRAYDVRGVADTELDDETVFRIGAAIATVAGELGEQSLAVACDGRASSGRIKAVLEKAILQAGRDVIDIGLVPTPLLYFATTRLDAKSGVMITGSHSPPDINGMKIVLKGQTISQGAIGKIRTTAKAGKFSKGRGHRVEQEVVADYLDEVAGDIAIAVPLKVVVDAGNGATAPIAPKLLEEMGCEVVPLFCEIDGTFPNRSPDTSDEDNLSALVSEVVAQEADFGVAYDGDGDRLAVVTGSGKIIRTDKLMMIFARDVVARNPGADVVYDVKCSRALAQLITSLGGRPVLWKTGHALMKAKMLETGALLGGEFSGHIFFGERWYGFDDAMYATGRLAEIISSQDLTLDELLADLPSSVSTPEILVSIADDEKFALIERFQAEAQFGDGNRNDLDGLRVDFEDGWGLLRASNTTAALTARFEANDEAGLDRIRDQFREQLATIAPDLAIPF